MEYRRLNAAMPALGKMDPRWLRIGEHRDLRKRVVESSRLQDTIRASDSERSGPHREAKDSVDQDSRIIPVCRTPVKPIYFHCCPANSLSLRERVGVRGSEKESYCFSIPLILSFSLRDKGPHDCTIV